MNNNQTTAPPADPNEPQVVYRRTDSPDGGLSEAGSEPPRASSGRLLAPALTPLLIGFTLLLIVISVLGFLSIRKIDGVGFAVLDHDLQQATMAGIVGPGQTLLERLPYQALIELQHWTPLLAWMETGIRRRPRLSRSSRR